MARTSRRLRLSSLALAAGAMILANCSAQPAAQTAMAGSEVAATQTTGQATGEPTVHPTSGLKIIPVSVISESQTHIFRTELADTPEAQARGMMFRTEMAPDEAMLFPSRTPEVRGFWMKNTPLPLDIIFVGADDKIINIAANTVPYSLDTVYSEGPSVAVLEVAGGRAAELDIGPGDTVEFSLPN